MKKTNRKNKTNMNINWPTSIFTIKDLHAANPDSVVITLRDKTKKAIQRGEVVEIGVLHNGLGRPTNVMVYGKVSDEHLTEAKAKSVVLKQQFVSESNVSVNVVTIDKSSAEAANQPEHLTENVSDNVKQNA